MKTAVYIEDGVSQIVLTPETEMEKALVDKLSNDEYNIRIFKGEFFDCRAGYARYAVGGDESLMIRLERKEVSE